MDNETLETNKIIEKQIKEYCEEKKYQLKYGANSYNDRFFFSIIDRNKNKILIKGIYDAVEEVIICNLNYSDINKEDIYDEMCIYNLDNFFDFLYDFEF